MKANILETLTKTVAQLSEQLAALQNPKSGPVRVGPARLSDIVGAKAPPYAGAKASPASPEAQARANAAYLKLKKGGNTFNIAHPQIVARSNSSHLTPAQIADIAVLLTKSQLSIADIAALYNKTKPVIYSIRDKMGLQTHRASPELMAGLARRKAELALKRSGLKIASVAPFEGHKPTAEEIETYAKPEKKSSNETQTGSDRAKHSA